MVHCCINWIVSWFHRINKCDVFAILGKGVNLCNLHCVSKWSKFMVRFQPNRIRVCMQGNTFWRHSFRDIWWERSPKLWIRSVAYPLNRAIVTIIYNFIKSVRIITSLNHRYYFKALANAQNRPRLIFDVFLIFRVLDDFFGSFVVGMLFLSFWIYQSENTSCE